MALEVVATDKQRVEGRMVITRRELLYVFEILIEDLQKNPKAKTYEDQEDRYKRIWLSLGWPDDKKAMQKAGLAIFWLNHIAIQSPEIIKVVHQVTVVCEGGVNKFLTTVYGKGGTILISPV